MYSRRDIVGAGWLNRYKADGCDPRLDRFTSLAWRLNYASIKASFCNQKDIDRFDALLDSYDLLPTKIDSTFRGLINLLNDAMQKAKDLIAQTYENSHTIGDKEDVNFRGEYLSSFRHQRIPWMSPTL